MGERAAFPPGEAREDWAIARALSQVVGHTLPFDSLSVLRASLFAEYPHLQRIGAVAPCDPEGVRALAARGGQMGTAAFRSPIEDFYLTNPIARASAVMAECSALAERHAQAAAE
jgi:NADH-quinone oxidoreductase subunit G